MVLAALTLCACSGVVNAVPPDIELEESVSIRIPEWLRVDGIAAEPGGLVLAWSWTDHHVSLIGTETGISLESQGLGRPIGAAFVSLSHHTGAETDAPHTLVEVIDGTGAIQRFALDGSALTLRRSIGVRDAVAAVRTSHGWITVVPDSVLDSSYHLLLLPGSYDGARVVHTFSVPGTERGTVLRLTDWEDYVIVASTRYPFTAFAFDPSEGRAVVGFDPGPILHGRDRYASWVAMPILLLPPWFIQTFADLKSDERALVVYNSDGGFARMSLMQAPLALVAHEPLTRTVIAMRRAGDPEVVKYRWSFTAR